MKKTVIIVTLVVALLQSALGQSDLKVDFRFEPRLVYQQPTFLLFDFRFQDRALVTRPPLGYYQSGQYANQRLSLADFGSRFNSDKLSFKELFRDSSFSVRSSDYVPGVKGVKIDKKGGEIWIKF